MSETKIYDRVDIENFISDLWGRGKKVAEFGVAGSIIGLLYQIIILLQLSDGAVIYLNFFSRTQVINDTMVIGAFLFFTYRGFIRGAGIYEKYFYNHNTNKRYLISVICFLLFFSLPFGISYFLEDILPAAVFVICFLAFGACFSFLDAITIHQKRPGTSKSHRKSVLLILGISILYALYIVTYYDFYVEINNQSYQVKYMNDMYIITERGVFDKDGNRFYNLLLNPGAK